jgi:tyrosine-protein kinase Etk/Wzc
MNTAEKAKDLKDKVDEPVADETLDVLDIFLVLARKRRTIAVVTLVAFCVGLLLSSLMRPRYTGKAVIMPPQQETSSSALLGQLGSLAALGGGAGGLGLKSPADLYIGILQSRTIADAIIADFHLLDVYRRKQLVDARAMLKTRTEIEAGKDGLIQISVIDHDPKRASDLANAYVTQLYGMNSKLAVTEAAQRRVFFDEQLEEERKDLAKAEEDLRGTQQRTGLIQLSAQAQMIIQSIAQLRAQIASREVQLHSIQTYATDQNPEVARLDGEISTMRQQLIKLENDQQRPSQPGDIAMPAGQVAEDSLEYARKFREVKYHETLFDLLSRQYEAARIDEAKSAPIIQIIDRAVPPDRASGPNRPLISIGAGVLGFLGACFFSFLMYEIDLMKNARTRKAEKLNELRNVFRLRFR